MNSLLLKSTRGSLGLNSFARRCFAATYEKTFMADDIQIVPRANLKPKPGPDHQYAFGGIQTDYMLEIDYDNENGGW